jgi:hypothetical protein
MSGKRAVFVYFELRSKRKRKLGGKTRVEEAVVFGFL